MKVKYVRTPSDYLTAGQRKELNGVAATYTMDKPHTYLELLAFPKDLRKQYLEGIINKYHPSIKQLTEEMLRTNRGAVYDLLENLEIPWRKREHYKSSEEKLAWLRFVGKDVPSEEEPKLETPKLEVVKSAKKESPVIHMTYPQVGYMEVGMTGKPFVVADSLTRFLDPNKEYRFAINVYEANSIPVANNTMEEPYGERNTGTED